MNKKNIYDEKLAIIGLGYVGLPLAIKFGEKFNVVAFDSKKQRIKELNKKIDINNEIKKSDFKKSKFIKFTDSVTKLKDCSVFIIAVPTPLKKNNTPDFKYLIKSSKTVGQYIKNQDVVIYESTVYPGATEEICIPILKKYSGLKYLNSDKKNDIGFYCGYSPERINPGDKKRTIDKIIKITSGSNQKSSLFIDKLYKSIITAGTHRVSSIKVAEAAKVIENTQRDLNIALVNELSIIFNKMNIDSNEVFNASKTKWNFIDFKPGLVGGHCISVDPYYLTFKSKKIGYDPKVILSGRKTNDNMSNYIFKQIKFLIDKNCKNKKVNILLMGITYKENCSDLRNSKIIDIFQSLNKLYNVDIFDPFVDKYSMQKLFKKTNKNNLVKNKYDVIVIGVPHNYFKKIGIIKIRKSLKNNKGVIIDIKNMFGKNNSSFSL